MEIHHQNYDFASEFLIKPYIAKSNKFESTTGQLVDQSLINSRPWLRGNASRTFGGGNNLEDNLPLKNSQYYELLELLIFNIHLPNLGMSKTLTIL
jgi:hypothetical protein